MNLPSGKFCNRSISNEKTLQQYLCPPGRTFQNRSISRDIQWVSLFSIILASSSLLEFCVHPCSKCILFAIQWLQLGPSFEIPWDVEWIVSEMVDWLKVCDPAFTIRKMFCNPHNWEEPNSGSSTAGSVDFLNGGCTQESWRNDSDWDAEVYQSRPATICRVGKCDPKVPSYVIRTISLGGGT